MNAPPTNLPVLSLLPVSRRAGRPPFAAQEVLVRDPITGHLLCAEYKHEKLRTKGNGDRFKVYHPMFGPQGRWVRHANFRHIGMAPSTEDYEKHWNQED